MSKVLSKQKCNISDNKEETLSPKAKKWSDEEQGKYVKSYPALIDKYIQYIISSKGIPFVVIIGIMGWIFIQDNEAGKLEDLSGIGWLVVKCGFFLGLYVIFLVSRFLATKISG